MKPGMGAQVVCLEAEGGQRSELGPDRGGIRAWMWVTRKQRGSSRESTYRQEGKELPYVTKQNGQREHEINKGRTDQHCHMLLKGQVT